MIEKSELFEYIYEVEGDLAEFPDTARQEYAREEVEVLMKMLDELGLYEEYEEYKEEHESDEV